MIKTVLLITLIFCLSSAKSDQISQWEIGNILGDENYHIAFMAPKIPGNYPVMVYSTGFGSLLPVSMFQDELERIAMKGVVIAGLFQIQTNFNYTKKAHKLDSTLNWIKSNIEEQMANNAESGVIANYDDQLMLGCQSAGCHITSAYLNEQCGDVKAHIMQDPVDGADPFGIMKDFVITPGVPAPWILPTLVEVTGKDYDSVLKIMPACAPKKHSCEVFYDAFQGPTWYANFTDYGHGDCLGPKWATASKIMCPACKGSSCSNSGYHQDLADMFYAFIEAVFYKDSSKWSVIENLDGITQKVDIKWKYNGFNKNTMGAFCTYKSGAEQFLN